MAAFIQKLFKKRSTSATSPANRRKASAPNDTAAEPTEANASRGTEQSAIDGQRAVLSQPDTGQASLAELATDGMAADIRLAAARRLTDPTLLQQVQKASRGRDKGVYQQVRHALLEIRRQQEETQATQAALTQVASQAEELATSVDTNLYGARIQKLEQQWQALASAADNALKTRVLSALHQCHQRAEELEARHQEEQRHLEQKTQRDETLQLLKETLENLAAEAPSANSLPSLDALQRTQENRWLEATRDTEVSRQQQKLYEQQMHDLRLAVSAVRKLSHHQGEIEALLGASEPSPEQAREQLDTLDWPDKVARPESVQQLARIARVKASRPQSGEDDQARQHLLEKLQSSLEQLETALAADQLKESRQHLKQAQGVQRQLTGKAANQYRSRLQRLSGQVRELGDWRGFATEPKQTALCEQMEYLADQPMEPEAKAAHIQQLQQEWRELGGSSNRDLWQRFRSASDRAFEPCRAYFEARSDLKKIHLQKRHNICDELRRYIEAADWNQIDWKGAERIEKAARQEWREAWPVEFRENRPVQKTFDGLLETLTSHLDEERIRNEDRKQAIVDRARELVDHEPLAEAMSEAKALQRQWQEIGITRHREDRKLWKAFRRACDDIFSRRDEQRQRREQEASEADQAAQEILNRSDAWLTTDGADEAEGSALAARLQEAANQPVSAAMTRSLGTAAEHIGRQLTYRRQQANIRQWQQWVQQRLNGELTTGELPGHWQGLSDSIELTDPRELVVLAEILSSQPSPEDDQPLRMELQVRRLKEGFESGQNPEGATLEALTARWCLGLSPESMTAALAGRFSQVLDTV